MGQLGAQLKLTLDTDGSGGRVRAPDCLLIAHRCTSTTTTANAAAAALRIAGVQCRMRRPLTVWALCTYNTTTVGAPVHLVTPAVHGGLTSGYRD